jgi:hypothetical protein
MRRTFSASIHIVTCKLAVPAGGRETGIGTARQLVRLGGLIVEAVRERFTEGSSEHGPFLNQGMQPLVM